MRTTNLEQDKMQQKNQSLNSLAKQQFNDAREDRPLLINKMLPHRLLIQHKAIIFNSISPFLTISLIN